MKKAGFYIRHLIDLYNDPKKVANLDDGIRLVLPRGKGYVDVTFEEGGVYIQSSEPMKITPSASNAIYIKMGRRR